MASLAPVSPGESAVGDHEARSVSLWFRLLSCHALMLAELRRELEDRITLARFDLLASLHREDGQTLAALSRALLVTAGNLTGLVDRAERDGVVERRPDPNDRRLARVWLTSRGRALIRDLLPAHGRLVHELLRGLPARERRDLRNLLGGLRQHLREKPERPEKSEKSEKSEKRTKRKTA
ncbi:MAG: MarR family transcriptional regulator [Labilithrix sp.]|nr:MarR family transcriptional regulator [Labilithrix sp.]